MVPAGGCDEPMMKSICFVVTTPFAVNAFLLTHLKALADRYAVTLCVNRTLYPLSDRIDPRIRVIDLPITRDVSLCNDLHVLRLLMAQFRAERYTAVHSITPKAGFLAMLAARLTGIRLRHHTFTGQVWATKSGFPRLLLKMCDQFIVHTATQVFSDSSSQCQFLEKEGIVKPGGISVLGPGSIMGVDIEHFRPNSSIRHRIRAAWGISEDMCVFLFVGRLARDKGIFDLIQAFTTVAAENQRVELWFIGPDEEHLSRLLKEEYRPGVAQMRWLGQTFYPEHYMASVDVLVLPSYREGFGSVVIEAAACGATTVAYRITGVIDAVIEEQTGILVDFGNVDALAAAMLDLSNDPVKRRQLGHQAKDRVSATFTSKTVTDAWIQFYKSVL